MLNTLIHIFTYKLPFRMGRSFIKRFAKHFNNTGVEIHTMKGNHFIMINSMAMQNDGCGFCNAALRDLNKISGKFVYISRNYI